MIDTGPSGIVLSLTRNILQYYVFPRIHNFRIMQLTLGAISTPGPVLLARFQS